MGKRIVNRVHVTTSKEFEPTRQAFRQKTDVFMVEIDGASMQSWEDYITEVQAKFRFPSSCLDSVDRYYDWIMDLGWLWLYPKDSISYSEFVLTIHGYSEFLSLNPEVKSMIISDLKETILPHWEGEIERIMVGGEAKSFQVYLVD